MRGWVGVDRRTRRNGGYVVPLLLAALVLTLLAIWLATRQDPEPSATGPAPAAAYPRFAAHGPVQADIAAAPTDPRHPAMLADLLGQIRASKGVVSINTDHYAASYIRADESTPTTDVRFTDCQRKGPAGQAMLDDRTVFRQVPIPADARPAPGSDGHLAIWRPATDQLWEFWQAQRTPDGQWQACWGGRIDQVSSSSASFTPPFGVSASGLSATALMISIDEARAGRIDHAIGMVLTDPGTGWSYPATRGDGTKTGPGAIPEGTRLRLDPAVDVEALPLTPFGRAVARAAQQYGFIVMDRGGAVVLLGESGRIEAERTGRDPWADIFGDTPPYRQLDGIPWGRLQVIQRDWGKPAAPSTPGTPSSASGPGTAAQQ